MNQHIKSIVVIVVLIIIAGVLIFLFANRPDSGSVVDAVNEQALSAQAQAAADAERIRQAELVEAANPFKDKYQNPFE